MPVKQEIEAQRKKRKEEKEKEEKIDDGWGGHVEEKEEEAFPLNLRASGLCNTFIHGDAVLVMRGRYYIYFGHLLSLSVLTTAF